MKKVLAILLVCVLCLSLNGCFLTRLMSSKGEGHAEMEALPTNAALAESVVLCDRDGVTVTATKLIHGGNGPELVLHLQNDRSADISVQSDGLSVNGYMIPSLLWVDVPANSNTTESLYLSQEDLTRSGISQIAKIRFSLLVSETESAEEVFSTDLIEVSTTAADDYVERFDDSGKTVFSGDYVKIVYKGLSSDNADNPELLFYVENLSDYYVAVTSANEEVNGTETDASLGIAVTAGDRAIVPFAVYDHTKDDLQSVTCSFIVYDVDYDVLEHSAAVTFDSFDETSPAPDAAAPAEPSGSAIFNPFGWITGIFSHLFNIQ